MKNKKITIIAYIDFKSPYAYLSIVPFRNFAKSLNINIDWYPYIVNIPESLGSAEVDKNKNIIINNRNSSQWKRVKYLYMDCRRQANLRNITLKGPLKIWDTTLSSIFFLYVKHYKPELLDAFMDEVYLRFWKRELDLEDMNVLHDVLINIGVNSNDVLKWIKLKGQSELNKVMDNANKTGVFGVPTYILNNEIFWGRENLPLLKSRLTAIHEGFF